MLINNYLYNDKELFEQGGLDWYNYGFRNYDPQIARFTQLDPLTDGFHELTPYQYASDEPIANVDLDGLEESGVLNAVGSGAKDFTYMYSAASDATAYWDPVMHVAKTASITGKFIHVVLPAANIALHAVQMTGTLLNGPITTKEAGNTVAKNRNYNIQDARNGLLKVYEKYGKNMASTVERLYRLETTDFISPQYKKTGTGGMEVHGRPPYYGWNRSFFSRNPQYTPIGVIPMYENKGLSAKTKFSNKQVTSRPKQYVIMPSVEAGMMFLSDYIKNHGGNFARWYSTDPDRQRTYRTSVLKRPATITNAISQTQHSFLLPDDQ